MNGDPTWDFAKAELDSPPSLAPTLPTPLAPAPAAIKEESEQTGTLLSTGSVNNPARIEESDDDLVIQPFVVASKRKKKGSDICNT